MIEKQEQQLWITSAGLCRCDVNATTAVQGKMYNIEKGLLQMQHLFVCLQGTFGDHPGGINKDCKQ